MYTGSAIRMGVTPLPNTRCPIFLHPSNLWTTFFSRVFTSSIAGFLDPSTFDHLHWLVTDYLVMHGLFRAIFAPRLGRTGWYTELSALVSTPDMTAVITSLSAGRFECIILVTAATLVFTVFHLFSLPLCLSLLCLGFGLSSSQV